MVQLTITEISSGQYNLFFLVKQNIYSLQSQYSIFKIKFTIYPDTQIILVFISCIIFFFYRKLNIWKKKENTLDIPCRCNLFYP